MKDEPPVHDGAVEAAITAELPGVGLSWCEFEVAGDVLRRSPPALRARLRALSDRHRGATAIALRSRAIPHAYRALFRHLGFEPDITRIPVEELMLERLKRGAYPSRGLLADALTVATMETEVGVWALDAGRLGGAPRLTLSGRRIEIADDAGAVAALFSPPAEDRRVTAQTRCVTLYAIAAPAVPGIAVEEALWTAWDVIDSG